MWNQMAGRRGWSVAGLLGVVGLAALLAGCGGSSAAPAASSQDYSRTTTQGAPGSSAGAPSSQARHRRRYRLSHRALSISSSRLA